MPEPLEIIGFASGGERLRDVGRLVKVEVPDPAVVKRYPVERGGARKRRIEDDEPRATISEAARKGIGNHQAYIVPDDTHLTLDAGVSQHRGTVSCERQLVVAILGPGGAASSAKVWRDDAIPRRDQRGHDFAPGDCCLGIAVDQQNGRRPDAGNTIADANTLSDLDRAPVKLG